MSLARGQKKEYQHVEQDGIRDRSCAWWLALEVTASLYCVTVLEPIFNMPLPHYPQRFVVLSLITAILFVGLILPAMFNSDERQDNSHSLSEFQNSGATPHPDSSLSVTLPQAGYIDNTDSAIATATDEQMNEIDRLEGLHDELTINLLAIYLREGDDVRVRQRALMALTKIDNTYAIDVIIQGLADSHEMVREATLRALHNAHYEEIDFILGQTLYGERSTRMRLLAIELLSNRFNASAEAFLTAATRDTHPEVRNMAEQALNAQR